MRAALGPGAGGASPREPELPPQPRLPWGAARELPPQTHGPHERGDPDEPGLARRCPRPRGRGAEGLSPR